MLKIGEELKELLYEFLTKPYIYLTNSRQLDTTYTNNKDYPIQVMVTLDFKASTLYRQINIYLDNTLIGAEYMSAQGTHRDIRSVYFIVPPQSTYRLETPSSSGEVGIYRWYET